MHAVVRFAAFPNPPGSRRPIADKQPDPPETWNLVHSQAGRWIVVVVAILYKRTVSEIGRFSEIARSPDAGEFDGARAVALVLKS